MPRTDGDTGLQAATLVAAVRAVASRRGLIRDSLAEPLVHAVGWELGTRLVEGELDVSDLSGVGGYAGMAESVATRTRFYDGFLADAGVAGIRQAVLLNSGLDARPYRLWWPNGTTVFDVDEPQIVELKTQALHRLGVTPAANRCAVGVDMRQDWPAALRRAGFDSRRPSVWIAEGLLTVTLPSDIRDRLLNDINELSAAHSRFAADYDAASEHRDVGEYLRDRGWVTVSATLDQDAEVAVLTRCVTAVRNVIAPATLDS